MHNSWWSTLRGVFVALVVIGTAVVGAAPVAVADQTRRVVGQGITASGGLLVDPAARIWISDALKGFCRLSAPSTTTPGTIESSTCLGGTVQATQKGPARPGGPALLDPTPASAGSGDEIALIPDAAAGSSSVIRAKWNPTSGTFSYASTLSLYGGDLRPAAVAVGPDRSAYVVFERARSVVRIVDPVAAQPSIRTVGFTASSGARSVAAGAADSSGVLLYIADGTSLTQLRAPVSGRSGATATASYDLGAVARVAFDPATAVLYAGTASAATAGADTIRRIDTTTGRVSARWATGFTRVGGIAVRGAAVLVADDAGLAVNPVRTGTGTVTEVTGDPAPPTPGAPSHDFTGDGKADVVALDGGGQIWLYPGDGAGGWQARRLAISGVQDTTAIVTPGDWNGDAKPDLLRRDSAGRMQLYPGDGAGKFGAPTVIGAGWGAMSALLGPGDWDGDGKPDVLARDSAGALWLYPGNGTGGWGTTRQIGSGWNSMTAIIGPGDWDGDGNPDVMARNAAGALWLYPGNGAGGWGVTRQIGSGWNTMTAIIGPGDWNGDRKLDIIARTDTGALWLYPGDGTGGWGAARQIGSGWEQMRIIA